MINIDNIAKNIAREVLESIDKLEELKKTPGADANSLNDKILSLSENFPMRLYPYHELVEHGSVSENDFNDALRSLSRLSSQLIKEYSKK